MHFRKICQKDSDEIYNLKKEIFPQGEYQSESENKKHCESENGICCLNDKNKIIGFFMFFYYPHEITEKLVLTITTFGIKKENRNKGVGKELFLRGIFILKKYDLYLHVRKSNLYAINMYKSVGFEEIFKIKNYYSWTSENEDALYFEKKNK